MGAGLYTTSRGERVLVLVVIRFNATLCTCIQSCHHRGLWWA